VKASALALLLGFALLGAGCESLGRGTEQEVVIETSPTGAAILLSDGQRCASPCRLTVPRYHVQLATISKPGCRSSLARLNPSVTGSPGWDGPDLYRTVYDYQLGGAYDIESVPLEVTLTCGSAARQSPPALTANDEALLAQFGQSTGGAEAPAVGWPPP